MPTTYSIFGSLMKILRFKKKIKLDTMKLGIHNRNSDILDMVLEMNIFHYVKKVFVSSSKFLQITGQNICQTAHMHN